MGLELASFPITKKYHAHWQVPFMGLCGPCLKICQVLLGCKVYTGLEDLTALNLRSSQKAWP